MITITMPGWLVYMLVFWLFCSLIANFVGVYWRMVDVSMTKKQLEQLEEGNEALEKAMEGG